MITVSVDENRVDKAIRRLKKLMEQEGVFAELKKRKYYEKPSQRKRRKKAQSMRRLRKARRRAELRADDKPGR